MAPLIVQAVATLVARVFLPWLEAVRAGLVVMFLFTASAHFTRLRHDLAAMIPPPFTGAMWLIYLTGVLELAGATALAVPKFRSAAAVALALMLLGLLPANIYAARTGVRLNGRPATALWFRVPLQICWIVLLWAVR